MAGRARHTRDLPTHLHVSGFNDSANNNDADNCEEEVEIAPQVKLILIALHGVFKQNTVQKQAETPA